MSVNASVRQTILSLEARRIAAMVGRDLDTLDPLLADDLSYAHSSGRRDTKATFLELVRSGHYLGVDFQERDVVPCGDAVIVRGRARMQVSHGGDPLNYPVLFLETYALRGERWQLVAWQATRAPE